MPENQALSQYTYSVIIHALHIIFNQSDNFNVPAFPALSAVMEWYVIGDVADYLGKALRFSCARLVVSVFFILYSFT